MTMYLMSMHYGEETPSDEELEPVMKALAVYNDELRAAGAWVFSAGLEPAATATVVRRDDGRVVTTDGPYLETKEHLGGFWVIQADDLDAALGWGAKAQAILTLAIEVRPVAFASTE
jgi:hypothetical protein